jgi:hypothetical protein
MSSYTAIQEKMSVQESQSWLQENLSALGDLGDTEFIQAIHDLKTALPKKPRVSNPIPMDDRREDLGVKYDEDKCDARVWLKPGSFAGQCRSKKKDGQFFCKCHQKEADNHGGKVKHLSYNQERPVNAFGDAEQEVLPWHDVVVDKPKKAKASKTSGDRAERKCGGCGETGHDKRKCPNSSKSAPAQMSVAELTALLSAAKLAEEKKVVADTETPVDDDKTLACSNQGDVADLNDFEQLEEDAPLSPASMAAAGTGLDLVADKSDSESDDDEDEDEDDDQSSQIDCTFEGVPYTRKSSGKVYDDDFDEVGEWKDGKIVFTKDARRLHKKAVAALCPDSEEENLAG